MPMTPQQKSDAASIKVLIGNIMDAITAAQAACDSGMGSLYGSSAPAADLKAANALYAFKGWLNEAKGNVQIGHAMISNAMVDYGASDAAPIITPLGGTKR